MNKNLKKSFIKKKKKKKKKLSCVSDREKNDK